MGYRCRSCGNEFETDAATYEPMTDTGNPRCPECGSGELSREMLPPLVRQETERTRKYPFGRLICLTENALLYDGPSRYQLREVFPFAEYVHNRVTRRFWGQGDVARLTEVQLALNKNMAQAIDNLRMNGNRPQEVPAEVPAYRRLGNRPGDQVPVPAAYMGLARYLEGSSYDVRLHQVVDQQLKEDFKEIAGVTPASLGFIGTPPPSGVALEKSLSAGNTRVGRQATAREQGDTDAANIIWQMMNQFYREPRSFNKRLPSGEVEAIVTEVSELPRDVFVKVSISVNREEKDKLFGQNLMLAVKDGHVGFYPDLMLPMMGAPDREVVKEIASREEQRQRALQAAAAPPGTNLPQGAGTESPPPGVPPEMAGALAPPRGP
jgi:DNA-directed RNA polymerase subunit RPC12/RpoP